MPTSSSAKLFEPYLHGSWVGRKDWLRFEAPASSTYRTIRCLTLGEVAWLRAFLQLRGSLCWIRGDGRHMVLPRDRGLLDGFVDHGFVILEEEPEKLLLLGGVGRFWRPVDHLPIDSIHSSSDFLDFSEPGFAKAVFAIQVTPEARGSILTSEIRMAGTDPAADRIFRRYWRIVCPISGILRRTVLRAVARRLATDSCARSPSTPSPGRPRPDRTSSP